MIPPRCVLRESGQSPRRQRFHLKKQQLHLIAKKIAMAIEDRRVLDQAHEHRMGQQLLMKNAALPAVRRPHLIECRAHLGQEIRFKQAATDGKPVALKLLAWKRVESTGE